MESGEGFVAAGPPDQANCSGCADRRRSLRAGWGKPERGESNAEQRRSDKVEERDLVAFSVRLTVEEQDVRTSAVYRARGEKPRRAPLDAVLPQTR